MNVDMAVFVMYMLYKIHSDLSKRKEDVCTGIKAGGI